VLGSTLSDRSTSMTGRRPSVLFVIGNLDPGGSELQLAELLERVHPLRVNASVAVLKPAKDPRLTERLRAIGIEPHVLSEAGTRRVLADAAAARRITGVMRAHRPDAVYAWLEEAALVSVPVARGLRIPSLVARRNVCGSSIERFPPMRVAIRRAESLASVVTGNSSAVVEEAIRRGISAERARLVENGHASASALPMPPGPIVALGYVAHFRNEKGHLRLLDALSRVRAETAWRIDLAGNGGLAGLVQSETHRRGLAQRVSLVGPITDPRAFWRDHHVAVLLSDYEGSPNALIEAGMAGRPLVGTDSGGTLEVVAPGTGFLVPLDDPGAASEALSRLIDDRELRERMGHAAHDHIARQFSMERFVNGHLGAIDEALSRSEVTTR
jgi:glycosyltransferase involved in cell wall biosynthesis